MVWSNLKQKKNSVSISTKQSTRHFLVVGFLKKEWTNFSTKWFLFNFVARVRNTLQSRMLCFFSQFKVADSVAQLVFSQLLFSTNSTIFFCSFWSSKFEFLNIQNLDVKHIRHSLPQRRTNFANWSQKQSVFWVVLTNLSRDKLNQLCSWSQWNGLV